jgi:hypothetical protein
MVSPRICKHIAKATRANAKNQSFVKELAKPTHVAKGIFAIAQKNKINLCFVDKLEQFDRV